MHNITVTCLAMFCTERFGKVTWETLTEGYPTAWQRSSTCGKSDEGDTGSNGLGNHEPPPYSPHLVPNGCQLFGPMKVLLEGQKFQIDTVA
jgi:hypothetical protein